MASVDSRLQKQRIPGETIDWDRVDWEKFREDVEFNGPPFVLAAQINGVCHANTLADTGNTTYNIISSQFVLKHQIERIKIRPQSIRGFTGPEKDKITEVARFS